MVSFIMEHPLVFVVIVTATIIACNKCIDMNGAVGYEVPRGSSPIYEVPPEPPLIETIPTALRCDNDSYFLRYLPWRRDADDILNRQALLAARAANNLTERPNRYRLTAVFVVILILVVITAAVIAGVVVGRKSDHCNISITYLTYRLVDVSRVHLNTPQEFYQSLFDQPSEIFEKVNSTATFSVQNMKSADTGITFDLQVTIRQFGRTPASAELLERAINQSVHDASVKGNRIFEVESIITDDTGHCCAKKDAACTSSAECCGGATCGAGGTCGCTPYGGDCDDTNHCCGGTTCVQGSVHKCLGSNKPINEYCTDNSECAQGYCVRTLANNTGHCCAKKDAACASSAECCGGATCGAGGICGCTPYGGDCDDNNHCCSGTTCVQGSVHKCLGSTNYICHDNSECALGYCVWTFANNTGHCCAKKNAACASSADCCGGATCGAGGTCGCTPHGGDCDDTNHCCGGTTCVQGSVHKCLGSNKPINEYCMANSECAQGYCVWTFGNNTGHCCAKKDAACASSAECCGGATCGAGGICGCTPYGGDCDDNNHCCSGTTCVQGSVHKCLRSTNYICHDNSECALGYCVWTFQNNPGHCCAKKDEACASSADCCGGATCGAGGTCGCTPYGGDCDDTNHCCNGTTCVQGSIHKCLDLNSSTLLYVSPLSVGIASYPDVMETFIKRNTAIPVVLSKIMVTVIDNQTAVPFSVYAGELPTASHNHLLGRFWLTGITLAPMGIPKFNITFQMDMYGTLYVSAEEIGRGNRNNITIPKVHQRLSPDDIKRTHS